jgi:Peptidase family M28
MLRFRSLTAIITQLALVVAAVASNASASANGKRAEIKAEELKEWLTYLASDEFEGRATFTEGLGLAAGHIAAQLKSWGVKPGGPNGSYFQRVAVRGVKSNNNSTITVEVNGQSRTFKNKEGITLPANVGSKRTLTTDQIEFVGYGLNAPGLNHNDYANRSVRGKVAVWLGQMGPQNLDTRQYGRALFGRSRNATEQQGAIAAIGPDVGFGRGPGGGQRQGGNQARPQQGEGMQFGSTLPEVDFTSAQRLDAPVAPTVSAQDEFLEFLFSGSDVKYSELKEKAARREPLPTFTLKNARITFNLDADYTVVRTQFTRNVVGIVEGTDPALKDTYVAFGAHYDHVGYAEGELTEGRRMGARGRVTKGAEDDRVWNGADDDGSGTVGLLGIAKAYATGPKPRRSLIFVWHAGEERGLLGSRYFADYSTVPIDRIVAQVNMDMIGRDRDNKPEEANTVYAVGSDRISTEFHNLTVESNEGLKKPLKVDYEMNDPADLEQIYYRSDHYSYAAKGIPIVFLTTGLHPDYHANTDSAEKINYEKMARIAQYAYEIGFRTADLDHAPARDNRGARVGKTVSGKLKL